MTHTLISFLGKVPKQNGEYRKANYDFEGDIYTSRFFGKALKEVIQPDKVILLGTSGSMWDVLVENMGGNEYQEAERLVLMEAVEKNNVIQQQLQFFEPVVKNFLQVGQLSLKLIPYGVDENEQIEILQKIAEEIQEHDQVTLDLTHGLRHLPMLGLLSAMYLQLARKVEIKGIYYGALDLTPRDEPAETAKTPVMRLDGLLKITDWLHALDGFNKTGNLAPFSNLLQRDGMNAETAHCLEEAAFFENTLNIAEASKPLTQFSSETKNGLTGIGALFQDSLKERIKWHKQKDLYSRQRENAYFYLKQGDYLRAAVLGYEAFVTLKVQQDKFLSPKDYNDRKPVKESLLDNQDFQLLGRLRNALAHAGTKTNEWDTLKDSVKLLQELKRLFDKLLPKESK